MAHEDSNRHQRALNPIWFMSSSVFSAQAMCQHLPSSLLCLCFGSSFLFHLHFSCLALLIRYSQLFTLSLLFVVTVMSFKKPKGQQCLCKLGSPSMITRQDFGVGFPRPVAVCQLPASSQPDPLRYQFLLLSAGDRARGDFSS